jgi:hypothetical protein
MTLKTRNFNSWNSFLSNRKSLLIIGLCENKNGVGQRPWKLMFLLYNLVKGQKIAYFALLLL